MASGTITTKNEKKWEYVGIYSNGCSIPFSTDADEFFFYGSKAETGGWETAGVHISRAMFENISASCYLASTGYSSRLTIFMDVSNQALIWNKTSSANADVNYVRVYKR